MVGMFLVDPEENTETNFFEEEETVALVGGQVSRQIQHFFDEYHEIVDVEHDDVGKTV